ncbi:MAG TPA: DUF4189 domain-containing protein [Gemmataceae bacterium]|nr:DUF4189 domain-containing protein [Gemmataceae bacterium]
MKALPTRILTLTGVLLAGLSVLALAPAASRADEAKDAIQRNQPHATGIYACLAYSPSTQKVGQARNCATIEDAQQAAVQACGAPDARPVIWATQYRYFALARSKFGTSGGTGRTAAEARANALDALHEHHENGEVFFCWYGGE